ETQGSGEGPTGAGREADGVDGLGTRGAGLPRHRHEAAPRARQDRDLRRPDGTDEYAAEDLDPGGGELIPPWRSIPSGTTVEKYWTSAASGPLSSIPGRSARARDGRKGCRRRVPSRCPEAGTSSSRTRATTSVSPGI